MRTVARIRFRSVDEYLGAQPQAVRCALEQVRSAIRRALPGSEEVISYNIPAYKLQGERVLFFAGFKRHYSIYPAKKRLIEVFKGEPGPHEFKGSTIRFPLSEPVPVKLIERIAKFRAGEVAESVKTGTPGKSGPRGRSG